MSFKTQRSGDQLGGHKDATISDSGGERFGVTMGVCGWGGLEEGTKKPGC